MYKDKKEIPSPPPSPTYNDTHRDIGYTVISIDYINCYIYNKIRLYYWINVDYINIKNSTDFELI